MWLLECRDFLIYTVLPEADIDALQLKQAMDGIGTNESMIIDFLAPASNERILAARKKHDQKVRPEEGRGKRIFLNEAGTGFFRSLPIPPSPTPPHCNASALPGLAPFDHPFVDR